jgi:predicted dehydrogenase
MGKSRKVTVVGTGDMGNQHVNGWQLAGHTVVSVVDIDLPRAQEMADKYGVAKVYADYKEAIGDPEVEIVSICLPLKFHAPVSIYAAEQGKHVFCEKPLAPSMEVAREMEAAVRKAGVQFGIGFQRNLAGDVEVYRSYIREGKLGRPLVLNSELLAQVRPKVAMHDRNGNMGPIMDACCHTFMLWQTILESKPVKVYGSGRTIASGRPELAGLAQLAIDTGVIVLEYESGDIATMTVSWGLAAGSRIRKHPDRIIGPLGGMEAAGGGKINVWLGDQSETVGFAGEKSLHGKQFKLFVDALDRGEPVPVGFRQGKDVLAVTLAIFKAMETGGPVDVRYED